MKDYKTLIPRFAYWMKNHRRIWVYAFGYGIELPTFKIWKVIGGG
jgi:hypothetical protein